MAKVQTEKAFGGQQFFGLPAFTGVPTAKVNGTNAALTALSSGILLTTPAAQNDTVDITYNPVDAANRRAEFFSPTTGQTITPTKYCNLAVITPAGTLAALTVTFPPTPEKEGQEFRVSTSQTITALTFAGGSALNAPATLTAGKVISFTWSIAKQEWVLTI